MAGGPEINLTFQSFVEAMQGTALGDFAATLPDPTVASLRDLSPIEALEGEVSKISPDTAANIFVQRMRAKAAIATENGIELQAAWKKVTGYLRARRKALSRFATPDQVRAHARSAMGVAPAPLFSDSKDFQRVAKLLASSSPARRQYLREALEKLGVGNPAAYLDSVAVNEARRTGFFLELDRGSWSRDFHLAADSGNFIGNIRIAFPKTGATITPEQLQMLIARGIVLMAESSNFILFPAGFVEQLRIVSADSVTTPLNHAFFVLDRAYAVGKVFSGRQGKEFVATNAWLEAGVYALSRLRWKSTQRKDYKVGENVRPVILGMDVERWFKQNPALAKNWQELLAVPNVFQILQRDFGDYFSTLIPPYFLEDATQADDVLAVELSQGTVAGNNAIRVRANAETLTQLRGKDLLEIYLLIHDFVINHRRYHVEIGLQALRAGERLSSGAMAARGMLYLFYNLQTKTEADLDDTPPPFRNALKAVQRLPQVMAGMEQQIAWEEVLQVKEWIVKESGAAVDNVLVEVIPMQGRAALLVHGIADQLSAKDWLYVLSAMAANPSRAIRINVGERSVVIGQEGEARDLYGSIAGNRMFSAFGVYDVNARIPSRIQLNMPGGIPAAQNAYYETASAEVRRAYTKALRWFASASIPTDWIPLATDSKKEARSKFLAMSRAWHPDKKPAPEVEALFKSANQHWEDIMKIYPLR